MIDLTHYDYINFLYSKPGKFKIDRKRMPSFLDYVASHAKRLAPDSPVTKSIDNNLSCFRRFWKGYQAREDVASLNANLNMPIHNRHTPAPVLTKYMRVALGPNVANALVDVFELSDPARYISCEVNAYSRDRHPPRSKIERKGRKVVMPASRNVFRSLPNWMPIQKKPFFEGTANKRNCTENRILNGIHSKMRGAKLSGKIELYTDRVPCSSCGSVIENFLKFHPDVKIKIIYPYPKEWWEGEYFEVGSLLRFGVDVTLIRNASNRENDVFWPDFWFYV